MKKLLIIIFVLISFISCKDQYYQDWECQDNNTGLLLIDNQQLSTITVNILWDDGRASMFEIPPYLEREYELTSQSGVATYFIDNIEYSEYIKIISCSTYRLYLKNEF